MDLFRLNDDENYDKICGQILFTTKGRLAYYCCLCGQYRDYESFIAHLLENCSQLVDNDLKQLITKSRLLGSKFKTNGLLTTCCPVLQDQHPSENAKLRIHEIPNETNEILVHSNDGLKLSFEQDLIEDFSIVAVAEKVGEYDGGTSRGSFDTDPEVQEKYYEESYDEYVNVESLEDEQINDFSEIAAEFDQIEELYDKSKVSYGLESVDPKPQEDSNSNNHLKPKERNSKPNKAIFENVYKKNYSKSYRQPAKTVTEKIDNPVIIRNVRARKKYLPSHIAPEERKHKCPLCNSAFKDRTNMNYHLKRHTNMKSYSCPDCGKKFFTSTEVRLHSRVHKKPAKKFLCTECGLAFETNYLFLDHQKRHTNQRDYICKICAKGFFTLGTLKKHLTSHSLERPYSCKLCTSSFKHPGGLKSHMKQHENKLEFKCQYCEAAYNIQAGLYAHMKSKHRDQNSPFK